MERIFRFLDDLPPHKRLRTEDGRKISSLHELSFAVHDMDSKTFDKHVSNKYNHFADWVYSKVKDIYLADLLWRTSDKRQTEKILHNRIMELQRSKYNHHFGLKAHIAAHLWEFTFGIFMGLMLGLIVARILI